ncbi:MAG: CrcB family protein [Acidimicrobiales bacterium]|nr:CrcB family protein [Acidimicrobiales bacterium]
MTLDPFASARRAAPARDPATIAVIAAGGALGSAGRYAVTRAVPVPVGAFPWATLAVNLAGALLLGLLLTVLLERGAPNRWVRPFAATGTIGAFTTFSAIAVEVSVLTKDGHAATAATYLAATLALGLVAVRAGIAAGHRLATTPERRST